MTELAIWMAIIGGWILLLILVLGLVNLAKWWYTR